MRASCGPVAEALCLEAGSQSFDEFGERHDAEARQLEKGRDAARVAVEMANLLNELA